MKLKSKSSVFKNIIAAIDTQLAALPTYTPDGMPLEEAVDFDTYVKGITNCIEVEKGLFGTKIDSKLATTMIYDELAERREQPDEQENKIN